MNFFKHNLSIEDYHSDNVFFSASSLKYARKSLLALRSYLDKITPAEKKPAFDFGNAFELALCDANEYLKKVLIFNENDRPEKDKGITSKLNQEWKKEIFNGGKYVITQEDNDLILRMIEQGSKNPYITSLISEAQYQTSFFWMCETSGLGLKARPDLVLPEKKSIVDIKTAQTAEPGLFALDAAKYSYPLQAMMQMEGARACGIEIENYYWLVYEKSEPYDVVLFEFLLEDQIQQEIPYQNLKKRVREAVEWDYWPGYADAASAKNGILPLELPRWYVI